ncbi:hypothetical protein JIQ42_07323 [Leishmania sp. Namibia]|uniref:hypothetical protein n=1 Tax=Leishmania sp. Namibia TaxID=2802991 RepID=UPI001B42E2D1|nr:hypothetical protein JIQ42_07323 [Leishmania sp. Namibia]
MYVTPLRICFTSSFIEEPLIILLENVLTLERKVSFVCDTIVVVTKARVVHDFTAFISTGVTQMYNLLRTLWSVREKYAADKASSLNPDEESDVSSSADSLSGRATSRASSVACRSSIETRDTPSKDTQSLTANSLMSTHGKQDTDGCTEIDRAVAPSPASHVGASASVEKQSASSLLLERSGSLRSRKSGLQERSHDIRPGAIPEFRRFFPSIPHNETIKDSFTCCYQFGASRLGKMWITQNFILFVSPMMDSRIEIKFSDVEKIEKEQKLVLLDGFYVQLKSGVSMSFSNFTSRDAAMNVIESTFQASKLLQKAATANSWVSGPLVFKTTTSENDEDKIPVVESMDALSQVETEYGNALSDFSCFGKEVITPVKVCTGKGVLDVFGVCFDDDSVLLEDYHAERKDTDQKWEPWRPTRDGGVFRGQRQFTCTTLVKAMMGKPYTYIEYQRYALFKVNGVPTLAVQFSSQVPGVMSENDEDKIPVVESMDALSQVETEYGNALSDFSCFGKEVITPVKVCTGKGVLDVFGVCFDDDSVLLEDYHAERKDTDQKWEPWRPTRDGGVFRGQRQFTCTTLVKAMMGKPYTYIEYQRYALFKVNGVPTLAVQFSSQVPGVMFGDAFRVEALVTFTQAGSGASAEVTMRVYGYVQFLKNVWVKNRILATAMGTELPEGYKKLAAMAAARMAGPPCAAPAADAAPADDGAPIRPEASSLPPFSLKPQTLLQRSVMAHGTTVLAALVVVVSLKSMWQTLFLSSVSVSKICAPARMREADDLDAVCQMMVAEWNGVLSAARPALVAIYLLLISLFCGVTLKAIALSEA